MRGINLSELAVKHRGHVDIGKTLHGHGKPLGVSAGSIGLRADATTAGCQFDHPSAPPPRYSRGTGE